MVLPFLFGYKMVCHVQSSLDLIPQHFHHRAHGLQLNLHVYQFEIFHKVQPVTCATKNLKNLPNHS